MQALILAAGMGKRLGKYTSGNTKCMLNINGKTLIERAIESLLDAGINKLVMVVGYKGDNVKKFLLEECKNPRIKEMELVFIDNPIYDKTNNIYSLFLAKDCLAENDTVLLESDLIFDPKMIEKLVKDPRKNLVSVAKYEQWMDGTVVKIGSDDSITEFIEKKDFDYKEIDKYYKTVNIYKLSKDFLEKEFIPFLKAYIDAYGENEYYELVLKIIAHVSRSNLKALDVSNFDWYEIDDAQDLDIATCMFSGSEEEHLANLQKRYGGYWRFDKLIDYCYLVNPYYPTTGMLEKINFFSKELITAYPSGQKVNCICASRIFNDIDTDHMVVGNGAAELISVLGRSIFVNGEAMLLPESAFNEYARCFEKCKLNRFDLADYDYKYSVKFLKEALAANDVLTIVNPDNPSGAFIEETDMFDLLDAAKEQNKTIIFDESFIDFTEPEKRYTLIRDEVLTKYPNLIVVKSISKSYGVPGIRLGVLASRNKELIQKIKQELPVWNINSYGEYFLQIANLYKKDYASACDKIAEERARMITELRNALPKDCTVYNSQANFILINLNEHNSTQLAIELLKKNIFIKDLRTKQAFAGKNFIRLAIRTKEENDELIKCLGDYLSK